MEQHDLDTHPIPRESEPIFINEPWMIDRSLQWIQETGFDPTPLPDADNIRIYLPMDICRSTILRRLADVILRYGPATEENALDDSYDVDMLIPQIEIYYQFWFVRHNPNHGSHSAEAIDLVKEFVKKLGEIQVYDAEQFPYDTIGKLAKEYLETE